jgi:hypothetical protein
MADGSAKQRRAIGRPPGRLASKFGSLLIRPTIVAGIMVALIAPANTTTFVPLSCNIDWTRPGGVWIYYPDCRQTPTPVTPSPPPPDGAPLPSVPPARQ